VSVAPGGWEGLGNDGTDNFAFRAFFAAGAFPAKAEIDGLAAIAVVKFKLEEGTGHQHGVYPFVVPKHNLFTIKQKEWVNFNATI
jgi:hypothetical protein